MDEFLEELLDYVYQLKQVEDEGTKEAICDAAIELIEEKLQE